MFVCDNYLFSSPASFNSTICIAMISSALALTFSFVRIFFFNFTFSLR